MTFFVNHGDLVSVLKSMKSQLNAFRCHVCLTKINVTMQLQSSLRQSLCAMLRAKCSLHRVRTMVKVTTNVRDSDHLNRIERV